MARILILGGDGYLGWPTVMCFSERGYTVTIVDNYFRQNAYTELDVVMLYLVLTLIEWAKFDTNLQKRKISIPQTDFPKPLIG